MKRELNFDNFHVYEGNKVAYLAAQKIIEFPGELFNPLYIYGGTGIGKTHLLWALHGELNKKLTTLFFSAKEFEKYLEEGKEFNAATIVDDIHTISQDYHGALLGIIDSFLANNRQICFSGNAVPRDLKNFDAKLLSRLEGGLVCDIQAPKEIALVDMIKKKSGEAGILLPDDVALELAQLSTGSLRAIEGMINRIIAYSSLGNVSLDIDNVRMILKEFYPKGIYSPVSSLLEELKKNASEVLQDVSEKLDVCEEYREKIYVWEMKGFDTKSLKPLLDDDVDLLKKEYDIFIEKVQRLVELQKEFGSLNTSNFPDEAMRIESMLFAPDRVTEIEELIAKIRGGAKVVEVEKTFDKLILGESNHEVFNIYREQVLNNLGKKFNPFVILGKKGVGKTRFLEAVYAELISKEKSVMMGDLASDAEMFELRDIDKYDVLLFDNFHHVFSAPEETRTKFFQSIRDAIKAEKAVILGSEIFPPDLSLSDEEKSVFEFGIEAELKEPSSDVVGEYIRSKLEPSEAESFVKEGIPQCSSFYEIDEFLETRKKKEPAEPAAVVPLGLPGEETGQTEDIAKGKEEVIPLGLPGEESDQTEEAVEEREVEVIPAGLPRETIEQKEESAQEDETLVVKEEQGKTEEQGLEIAKGKPLKEVREERFIIQEIMGEMIEDNY